MDIKIQREIEEQQNVIPPVFPVAVDFENLLLNKFETLVKN